MENVGQPASQPAEAAAVTACPLCGSARLDPLFVIPPARGLTTRTYTVLQCADCELGITNPRPTDAEVAAFYDEDFYGAAALRSALVGRFYELSFRGRRKHIERYVTAGRLLDVGCGDGRFVASMAGRGWEAVGYDLSPTARVLVGQSVGQRVKILGGRLEDHDLEEGSFDLITLWQVLEHVAEPHELLKLMARLLRPGGLIAVAVPNLGSLQAKIAGDRWWGLDVPRHLTHFTPETLRRMLTQSSFTVRELNHFSFRYAPYSLFHSLLDRLFTRRDFLSDLAKRTLPPTLGKFEYGYNVAALTVASPVAASMCVLDSLISPSLARGGFIEAYATK